MLDEARRRTAEFQQRLKDAGVDIAILTDESSIAYLAGFWGYLSVEFGRPTFLIVRPDEAPVVLTPLMESEMVSAMTWVENVMTWEDAGENYWPNVLRQAIGGAPESIAVELDALPAIVRNFFDDALPATTLTNVSPILGAMRMIKSPEEIEVMRQAGQIAGAMMAAAEGALAEGAPEYEAALAVINAGSRKAAGFLTERGWDAFVSPMIHNLQIMQSGRDTSMVHRRASVKASGDGAIRCTSASATWRSSSSTNSASIACSSSARHRDEAVRVQQAAIDAQQAAIAAIRPGVSQPRTVADAANAVYRRARLSDGLPNRAVDRHVLSRSAGTEGGRQDDPPAGHDLRGRWRHQPRRQPGRADRRLCCRDRDRMRLPDGLPPRDPRGRPLRPRGDMRVSIFQSDTAGLTPDQRVERLAEAARTAETDLILCPELFLSGYAAGAPVTALTEAADGPYAGQIAEIARETATAVAYGYPETAEGVRYNAAQCFDSRGVSVANHRKLMLPPGFEADVFTPSQGLTLFDLGGVRFGLLICYDIEFPEAVRATAEAGAQAILAPTALGARWGVVANRVVPARAFENGVYVLYANHAGVEGDIVYLGESCIVGPDGKDLARAGGAEEILTAEIDPARVAAAQDRLPYHRDLRSLRERLPR